MTSLEVAKRAYNLFLSSGVTKEGACAIIGNLQAESVLIPNNLEDSYSVSLRMSDVQYTTAVDNGTYTNFVHDCAGYGLAQWTYYTRKQKLLNYAKSQSKSIGDLDMQLSFLIKEFQEDFPAIWSQLKSGNNLYDLIDKLPPESRVAAGIDILYAAVEQKKQWAKAVLTLKPEFKDLIRSVKLVKTTIQ